MDMSLYPHAVAMSADEFMSWSDAMINDLLSSGTKKTVDELTGPIWSWAMKNSMHPLHWGLACCALEMAAASAPRYDAERYGMIYRSSPRQTDILLVNGWISKKIRPDLRRLYEQIPNPKWVVAMGECAISGWASAPSPADPGTTPTTPCRVWTRSSPSMSTSPDAPLVPMR